MKRQETRRAGVGIVGDYAKEGWNAWQRGFREAEHLALLYRLCLLTERDREARQLLASVPEPHGPFPCRDALEIIPALEKGNQRQARALEWRIRQDHEDGD